MLREDGEKFNPISSFLAGHEIDRLRLTVGKSIRRILLWGNRKP
jgi:hypothetical protein